MAHILPDAPLPLVPATLRPFDLQAPARLLVPGLPHNRSGYSERSMTIDHYDGPVVLTVTRWGSCRQDCKAGPGGHDARLVRQPGDLLELCRPQQRAVGADDQVYQLDFVAGVAIEDQSTELHDVGLIWVLGRLVPFRQTLRFRVVAEYFHRRDFTS